MIEHVPELTNVAVVPLTVHTEVVVDANATVRPELALALSVSGVPTVCAAIVPNVIVCPASTLKLCVTVGAAAYVELPVWFAAIVHVPVVRNVATPLATVQTGVVVDVNVTGKLELAVALSVNGVPTACEAGCANRMVCVASTPKLCVTAVAAAYAPLPAWFAVIEHVPALRKLATLPVTVHTELVVDV